MPENRPLLQESAPIPGSVADIKAGLDALKDQGFITDWRRERMDRWTVEAGATYGPYTRRVIFGFIEGARAMGANV